MRTIITAALALFPTLAGACVITPPACYDEATGTSYESVSYDLADKPDLTTSVFWSRGEGKESTLQIVECVSGRGVMLRDLDRVSDSTLDEGIDYMVEAANSERSYPLRDIREHLRQMGLETRMITWPKGHCACQLQAQPIIGCPAGMD